MPKKERKLPVSISFEEVELLLNQANGDKPLDIRNKAMIELMYGSGLRVTELIELISCTILIISAHSSYYTLQYSTPFLSPSTPK